MNYSSVRSILIISFAAASLVLLAAPASAVSGARGYPVKGFELEIGSGSRVDQFNWNKAGIPDSPPGTGVPVNVLSELTWTDLEIVEFSLRGRKSVRNMYMRGSFNLGFIHSGRNADSDYAGNNRTVEYSRSLNNGGSGTVWDLSIGGGDKRWVLSAGGGSFVFRPLVGLSAHKQDLTLTDGFQAIPASGAFPGLNSSYKALWFGPWAGFDADYTSGALALYGSIEMHGALYRAEADWNLRGSWKHPVSFEHMANAIGVAIELGADYAVTDAMTVVVSLKRQDWHAFPGTDRIYHASGAISDNRLNEVNWISNSFSVGLKFVY